MILKNAEAEANMVLGQYPGDLIRPANFVRVGQELGTISRSLIHFVCHGKDSGSGNQCIRLDEDDELSSANLLGIDGVGEIFATRRPVVFLNACEIGRTIPSLVGLGGFVASFIKLGATAVIAPLWSVEDSVAHDIATYFYEQLKANPKLPLSEIFKQIRRKGYDPEAGKDTYVAYCFYGDPSAAIAQRITAPWFPPSLTFNFAGDPAAEYRVVTEVASYGKQLGWLTEIAIALANRQPLPEETLRRLEKATKDIDAIKKEVRASSVKAAKNALDDPSMG